MQIKAEPVGDLAVISRLIEDTNLSSRIDEHFPKRHLWQGPRVGKTLQALLMYILSENDHRLHHVEAWASNIEQSLAWLLEEPGFKAQDLTQGPFANGFRHANGEAARAAQVVIRFGDGTQVKVHGEVEASFIRQILGR
ncbi:MAG: hypothetical protein H6566_28590 [Lewinellaceae bacterium]|nr:hypothetical protein [Lewinellaceae bacterium]